MSSRLSTQLGNLRDRISDSDEISKEDKEAIQRFDDRLTILDDTYGEHRHIKLLRHVTIIAENNGHIADSLKNRGAAESIVRWINSTYDNPNTRADYRTALRVFGRRVEDEYDDDPPPSIDWIKSGTSSDYDPTPDPRKMLDWHDDVLPMIDATFNSRDAAMIAVQFDAGFRGGEFHDPDNPILVSDVDPDGKYGPEVTVEGRRGRRTVTLTMATPYLLRWLEDHPGGDPNDPLWSGTNSNASISERMVSKAFDSAAERASIHKPVTLTNFRKSSATDLAKRGVSQTHLENHHGWVRGSRAAARYISEFQDESDREVARARGVEIPPEDEPEPTAPYECHRCDKSTPRNRSLCVWCGAAMDTESAEKAEQLEDILVEALAAADGNDAHKILNFRDTVRDDPGMMAEALDEIEHLLK